MPRERDRTVVAIVLAVGLVLALVMLMFGVVWDAVRSDTPGISDNSVQLIGGAFGGIIGVLGAYLGYRVSREHDDEPPPPPPPDSDSGQSQ